jgi:hypothetical protein
VIREVGLNRLEGGVNRGDFQNDDGDLGAVVPPQEPSVTSVSVRMPGEGKNLHMPFPLHVAFQGHTYCDRTEVKRTAAKRFGDGGPKNFESLFSHTAYQIVNISNGVQGRRL